MKKKKMDRYLVSTKQQYEIDWIIKKMKKEGHTITKEQILTAVNNVGRSRRAVYNLLRSWK